MDSLIWLGPVRSLSTGIMRHSGLDVESHAEISAMIMAIHLTGRLIGSNPRLRARNPVRGLLEPEAKTARLLTEEGEKEVPVTELKIGDVLIVKPGKKIPTDGIVESGHTSVDESIATGESLPVGKKQGDAVTEARIKQNGAIRVRATRVLVRPSFPRCQCSGEIPSREDSPAQACRQDNHCFRSIGSYFTCYTYLSGFFSRLA